VEERNRDRKKKLEGCKKCNFNMDGVGRDKGESSIPARRKKSIFINSRVKKRRGLGEKRN